MAGIVCQEVSAEEAPPAAPPMTGQQLYRAACAACHGADGKGNAPSVVGFDLPLPDFTECSFATREADRDWLAVTHRGGPARAFAAMMPSFGRALTDEEVQRSVDYVRGFCRGRESWPRGELNLPRALATEKAFPEDEAVVSTSVALEGPVSVMSDFIYETRLGERSQVELIVPFGVRERQDDEGPDGWEEGIGDIAVGLKHDLFHSLVSKTILSVAGELFLPTGDEGDDLGKGTFVFEPFLALGQIIPDVGFVQLQVGAELPFDPDRAGDEAFWRAALGRTFTQGRFGRTWTPMVEVVAARDLEKDAVTHWDYLAELQVALSTRQHVLMNLGVRMPMNDIDARPTEAMAYLLWDWFDGSLLEGW